MTEFVHTLKSVYEIDHSENLIRRVWGENPNSVLADDGIWVPFVSCERYAIPGGDVLRILGPRPILTSRILS